MTSFRAETLSYLDLVGRLTDIEHVAAMPNSETLQLAIYWPTPSNMILLVRISLWTPRRICSGMGDGDQMPLGFAS